MKNPLSMFIKLFASTVFLGLTAASHAQIPQLINYQGQVLVGGTSFDGTGQFRFAFVNASGTETFWSNDGTSVGGSEPTNAVMLQVQNGRYSVLLGNSTLANMIDLPVSTFAHAALFLRVWFDDGSNGSQQLSPDQRMAAVGFAFRAASVEDQAVGSAQLASDLMLGGTTSLGLGLSLPSTTGPNDGVIAMGGIPLIHSYGDLNFFSGPNAGNFSMTGTWNSGFGWQALFNNATGEANTAVGTSSLQRNTDGSGNTATGHATLAHNTTGLENTATGSSASVLNTTGDRNTATGAWALSANTTGHYNTAVGAFALGNAENADDNTAVGHRSLFSNTSGFRNTATGAESLVSNTTGTANTAVGSLSLYHNTTGGNNTSAGDSSLHFNTTGHENTAVGRHALFNNTVGDHNAALGYASLMNNTTGRANTATGSLSLHNNTTGFDNTATGHESLLNNTTGNNNTSTGRFALGDNTIGNQNTATGNRSLRHNISGEANTATGALSLRDNTAGGHNTATGASALAANTTGGANTATGSDSLRSNTTGLHNTGTGTSALADNTTGGGNSATGSDSLRSNTAGFNNTASGIRALSTNTIGSSNTAVGADSLANNPAGTANLALGSSAGANLTSGDYNVFIANPGTSVQSRTISIGNPPEHERTFIAGIRGTTTRVADGIPVLVDSEGQLGTISSSRRYKEAIKPMAETSERLHDLNPVTFRYKKPFANGDQPVQFGLIAEEVEKAFPELVVHNETGQPETVKYQDLAPLLLNEVQKLKAENDMLRKELAKERDHNRERDERLARIEARLNSGTQ